MKKKLRTPQDSNKIIAEHLFDFAMAHVEIPKGITITHSVEELNEGRDVTSIIEAHGDYPEVVLIAAANLVKTKMIEALSFMKAPAEPKRKTTFRFPLPEDRAD